MTDCSKKILLVDDDASLRKLLKHLLTKKGYEVEEAIDGIEALEKMTDEISVVVLDHFMPRKAGLDCLPKIKKQFPGCEIIMLSAGGIKNAVVAMKEGAFWYIQKPIESEEFLALVQKACEHQQLRKKGDDLYSILNENSLLPKTFSENLPRSILAQIHKIASLDCPVLIAGETGTGKTSLARYLHLHSKRANGPMISVSCASFPRDNLEIELFGYERGAFTGAHQARAGRTEVADTGTLFLDEIGDIPLDVQPKLVAFLENQVTSRMGSTQSRKIDTRVISATHQNIEKMCAENSFRMDLYFRLKVMCLYIPPLRERTDDLPQLCTTILKNLEERHIMPHLSLHPDAIAKIQQYDWPGNMRELEHCLERAAMLSDTPRILPEFILLDEEERRQAPDLNVFPLGGLLLSSLEHQAIFQTLQLCGGNKKAAAQKLGISEKSIYNKIQRFERKYQ